MVGGVVVGGAVVGGAVVGGRVVVGTAVGVVVAPVQATPLRVKLAGTGLVALFHAPLNPIDAVAPELRTLLYDRFVAVTWLPLCAYVAFQPWVTLWPAAKFQTTCQPFRGSPRFLTLRLAVKPPPISR